MGTPPFANSIEFEHPIFILPPPCSLPFHCSPRGEALPQRKPNAFTPKDLGMSYLIDSAAVLRPSSVPRSRWVSVPQFNRWAQLAPTYDMIAGPGVQRSLWIVQVT